MSFIFTRFVLALAIILLANPLCAATKDETGSRPNFIVIMADDMGYSDLGCTGGEIETPNLDKLANDGVLFTNFYSTSRCCPSRAALMTGQYQWDTGIGHMTYTNSKWPEYQKHLNFENVTIAEVLGAAGYQTTMCGKWHIGDKREHWPDKRGFQTFFGSPLGGGLYFYPSKFYKRPLYRNDELIEPEAGWYSTDGFTDHAVDFIEKDRDPSRPFFMYVAYIAPHFPLQAKPSDIAKYENTYRGGYAKIRDERIARQRRLGLIPESVSIPKPEFPEWPNVKNQQAESREMAVYAAMVDCMDQNIGRIVDSLKKTNQLENTVIMFLSDNGACRAAWNKTPKAEIGSPQSNSCYGIWYNVSNAPYRECKNREHEGGIVTPLVFHWPAGQHKQGRLIRRPAHIMDILPTCLEIADVQYPQEFADRTLDPIDGVSFAGHLKQTNESRVRKLFWEHEGNRAVRHGNMKLVSLHKKPWELYDLSKDPYETDNLISDPQYFDTSETLKSAYKDWAAEHGVRPWPLKKGKP